MRTAGHHKTALALLLLLGCTTDRTRRAYLERNAADSAPPQRVAIIIPGFGVTRLYDPVTRRYVWGTAHSTLRSHFEDGLDLPLGGGADRLVPRGYAGSRGPVNVGWQLMEALREYGRYERGTTVRAFEYDWRLSARDNAARLGALVARVSEGKKVDLVTHSAGALVALTYVQLLGGASSVENLVMIAPPRRGVVDAFRVFVRPEKFLRREFSPDIVATWPAITELLPEDGRFIVDSSGKAKPFDGWDAASWRSIIPPSVQSTFAESLRRARDLRSQIASRPIPPGVRVTVIAGDCVPTARRVLRRADGTYVFYRSELKPSEQRLASELFEPGDGTVPVSSTRAGAEPPLLFCDGHQGIATDPNVHRALIRVLQAPSITARSGATCSGIRRASTLALHKAGRCVLRFPNS